MFQLISLRSFSLQSAHVACVCVCVCFDTTSPRGVHNASRPLPGPKPNTHQSPPPDELKRDTRSTCLVAPCDSIDRKWTTRSPFPHHGGFDTVRHPASHPQARSHRPSAGRAGCRASTIAPASPRVTRRCSRAMTFPLLGWRTTMRR